MRTAALFLVLGLAARAGALTLCCDCGPTTTTLPGCATPGDACGLCAVGFCFARLPSGDHLCADGTTCDVVPCANDADCTGDDAGKFCVDGTPFDIPSACCGPCEAPPTTTTTTLPPCNVRVWCDLCDAPSGPPGCTVDGDCNPGFVCHSNTGGTMECVWPICVVNSHIACNDGHATDRICGGAPCGGGSPPPDCGQPCTSSADCGNGTDCVSSVDTTGPTGYQDQCKAACGSNSTVANCETGGCDCTTTTSTTTTLP